MSPNVPTPVQLETPVPVEGGGLLKAKIRGTRPINMVGEEADLDAESDGDSDNLDDLVVVWGFVVKKLIMSTYSSASSRRYVQQRRSRWQQ